MNSELIVKDVEFHGDILRAAQDSDGEFKEDGVGDWEYDRTETETGDVID